MAAADVALPATPRDEPAPELPLATPSPEPTSPRPRPALAPNPSLIPPVSARPRPSAQHIHLSLTTEFATLVRSTTASPLLTQYCRWARTCRRSSRRSGSGARGASRGPRGFRTWSRSGADDVTSY